MCGGAELSCGELRSSVRRVGAEADLQISRHRIAKWGAPGHGEKGELIADNRLYDSGQAAIREDQTVVVNGDRIAMAGPSAAIAQQRSREAQ